MTDTATIYRRRVPVPPAYPSSNESVGGTNVKFYICEVLAAGDCTSTRSRSGTRRRRAAQTTGIAGSGFGHVRWLRHDGQGVRPILLLRGLGRRHQLHRPGAAAALRPRSASRSQRSRPDGHDARHPERRHASGLYSGYHDCSWWLGCRPGGRYGHSGRWRPDWQRELLCLRADRFAGCLQHRRLAASRKRQPRGPHVRRRCGHLHVHCLLTRVHAHGDRAVLLPRRVRWKQRLRRLESQRRHRVLHGDDHVLGQHVPAMAPERPHRGLVGGPRALPAR